MSHLADHARAARILGETIGNRATQMGDPTGVLTCLAEAYVEAAEMMTDLIVAEQLDHACTLNHRALPAGKRCPSCNAAKEK